MYRSIANSEGIKAVKTSFENFPRRTVATKVITTFLSLILALINFVFNCKNYLQIKGCAVGTSYAPAYANIFMDHFVRKYIYPCLEGLSPSYFRFIDDDIFFIWTGSKDQLITFLNDLNTKRNFIKFEYKLSQPSIPSLNTEVYIKNNKLYTKIYRKESDRQTFFHINSEDPISLKTQHTA